MIENSSHAGVQHFLGKLSAIQLDRKGTRGLVVGFGEGHEADFLQRHSNSRIIGIDVSSRIPAGKKIAFCPLLASAMSLPFKPRSFDFVFYHHVIEHVQDPLVSLQEIHRLLVPGGVLYIGTPNRHRIIGYLGAYKISVRRKIRNNLLDYKDRLIGRFRNELGAHAGFSQKELQGMLAPLFTNLEWLTDQYLVYKYRERLPDAVLRVLVRPNILEFAASSIYVLCRKKSFS